MYDPLARQFARQAEVRTANLIRNKFQLIARSLESRAFQMLSPSSQAAQSEVWALIGEIKSYVEIRRELCPEIAQDGYSNTLRALIVKLQQMTSPE